MAYELHVPGRPVATFDTEPEAIEAARAVMLDDPDAEPEVRDAATGKPAAPGASAAWREELKTRTGF